MKSEDIIKIENLSVLDDVFIIRWNMTYLCNYNCDFCIQGNKEKHIENSKEESQETREKIVNNLVKFIETKLNKKYKKIQIFLIGGEITILKDFLDVVTKLVECKFEGTIEIHITTNLSTKEEILNSLVELFNRKNPYPRILEISASFYKNFANEEEFAKKVKLLYGKNKIKNKTIGKLFNNRALVNKLKKILGKKLYNKGKKIANKIEPIHVNINYPLCSDEDYKDYLEFVKKYNNIARKIGFIIIREYKTSISEKLKKKIDKKYYKSDMIRVTTKDNKQYSLSNTNKIGLLLDGEPHFKPKGYLCDAGMNNISIDNLGIVSRCSTCKNSTIIGDMKIDTIDLPDKEMICGANRCSCNYYRKIQKSGL